MTLKLAFQGFKCLMTTLDILISMLAVFLNLYRDRSCHHHLKRDNLGSQFWMYNCTHISNFSLCMYLQSHLFLHMISNLLGNSYTGSSILFVHYFVKKK